VPELQGKKFKDLYRGTKWFNFIDQHEASTEIKENFGLLQSKDKLYCPSTVSAFNVDKSNSVF